MKSWLYTSFLIVHFLSCAVVNHNIIKVHERNSGSIRSISMVGNNLDFYLNHETKPYRCAFNAGMMITKTDTYYTLNISSRNQRLPFRLTNKDSLKLKIDDSIILLPTLDVSRSGDNFSGYYRINYWDLLDMGNADEITVFVLHGDTTFHARYSKVNIYNYRYYNARYILKTTDIPIRRPKPYEQPWGFLSGGGGTTYDFWTGYYTNFFLSGSGFGDFVAAGFGISPFSYTEWQKLYMPLLYPGNPLYQDNLLDSWLEFNEGQSQSFNFHLMYGIAQFNTLRKWSVEIGLSFFYYWSDKRWINAQDRYLNKDILTIVESGTPFKGPAIGGFLQIAGLWFQYNSKPSWTVGLALPVPWW
jgi:hypothetical protein